MPSEQQENDLLGNARKLVEELESGNNAGAGETLDTLAKLRETELFQQLGKLTRELHDAMSNVELDQRFSNLATQDIPDAKERLSYVINMTEESANKTLEAVEASLPISEDLQKTSSEIYSDWQKFKSREMSADEFRTMSAKLDVFLPRVNEETEVIHQNLSDVMMAQGFQDLTGQIIRRVIDLVVDVEDGLVELIRLSGVARKNEPEQKDKTDKEKAIDAQGPAVPNTADVTAEVVQGQDEVDDLLSSLGF
jgi:chemotaxis protein CheZ